MILRRSKKNARLAANLHRYLNMASIEAAADRLADVPTRELPDVARQTRTRQKAEFDAWLGKADAVEAARSTMMSQTLTTEEHRS